jgi:hypothetical protein
LRSISILLAGAACFATVPAFAEESADAEITVTGIRQAYQGAFEAKEVPQAVSVISSETLEDNVILRLTDALDLNASDRIILAACGIVMQCAVLLAMTIFLAAIWSMASMAVAALAGRVMWLVSNGLKC